MLNVSDAQSIVLRQLQPIATEVMPITSAVLGLVLAEDVVSDIDMPPFDMAMMDGYAVRAADLTGANQSFPVIEEITAGRMPVKPVGPGQATRIMTGSPLPTGADAVVPFEKTKSLGADRVEITGESASPGKNVTARGKQFRLGDRVLAAGTTLSPAVFGLLASVGRTSARVFPPPRVAIVATGNELIDAVMKPLPGQIRNSNGTMLVGLTSRSGGLGRFLGIAQDDSTNLLSLINEGLGANVLLLTGGVSTGTLDLVPEVLKKAGVTEHFHKVDLKPGRPVYFGTGPRGTAVFGLPGNPVSAFVCFELFVRPALRKLGGHADLLPRTVTATLAEDFTHRSDRPTYHPGFYEETEGKRLVRPVHWLGSNDLKSLTRTNALLPLPAGELSLKAGQAHDVIPVGN